MRPPDRRDFLSVARYRQPVVDGGTYAPPLDRRIAGPRMAGDQQDHPLTINHRLFQRPVDRLPGAIETMAVKVDNPVRPDVSGTKPPIPARVERIGDGGARRWIRRRFRRRTYRLPDNRRRHWLRLGRDARSRRQWLTRQRSDGFGDFGPKGPFVRGQAAQWPLECAQRCPSAAGSARCRSPTSPRPCAPHNRRRPRMCRNGWRP